MTTTDTKKQAVTVPGKLKDTLDKYRPQIAAALQQRVPAEYFIRVVLNEVQRDDAIMRTSEASRLLAILNAAALGLPPSSPLGLAYLVPFKGRCALVIGYRGYEQLARDAAGVEITSRIVYRTDDFSIDEGTEPKIVHRPDLDAVHTGDTLEGARGVYAIATFPSGLKKWEYMPIEEVVRIREETASRNGGKAGPVWTNHPAEMARKTVIRRLAKYLPLVGGLAQAMELENAQDDDRDVSLIDASASVVPEVEYDGAVLNGDHTEGEKGLSWVRASDGSAWTPGECWHHAAWKEQARDGRVVKLYCDATVKSGMCSNVPHRLTQAQADALALDEEYTQIAAAPSLPDWWETWRQRYALAREAGVCQEHFADLLPGRGLLTDADILAFATTATPDEPPGLQPLDRLDALLVAAADAHDAEGEPDD